MLAPPSERAFHFHMAAAYDYRGNRRPLRAFRQHGIWAVCAYDFELPSSARESSSADRDERRRGIFQALVASRRLTARQLATINALAFGRYTIAELAAHEGCSRQAIVARIIGNSRGQGGLVRRARRLLADG
jgi:hypothetical protein